MREIFISYRRSESSDVTGRIFDQLKTQFGEECLFKDVDAIPIGQDFRAVIEDAVSRCVVLLAIIGREWISMRNDSETRRIDDPNDYVRLEIAAALRRGIPVVPILVSNADPPAPLDLPEPIRDLAFRQSIPVRPDPDFHTDITRLCTKIAEYLPTARRAPSFSNRLDAFSRYRKQLFGVAVLGMLLGFVGLTYEQLTQKVEKLIPATKPTDQVSGAGTVIGDTVLSTGERVEQGIEQPSMIGVTRTTVRIPSGATDFRVIVVQVSRIARKVGDMCFTAWTYRYGPARCNSLKPTSIITAKMGTPRKSMSSCLPEQPICSSRISRKKVVGAQQSYGEIRCSWYRSDRNLFLASAVRAAVRFHYFDPPTNPDDRASVVFRTRPSSWARRHRRQRAAI